MAAKKKPTPPSPKPKPSGGMKPPAKKIEEAKIDRAYDAIWRTYGNNLGGTYGNSYLGGSKTLKEAVQALQDVVAESSLVEKYSMRVLDAAAARVARNAWNGLMRAEKYGKGRI